MYIGVISGGPFNMKLKFSLIITISIPNMVPNMSVPMFGLAKKENNNLDNMHNKNIYGDYYTYHLFCLFLQFCKHLNS